MLGAKACIILSQQGIGKGASASLITYCILESGWKYSQSWLHIVRLIICTSTKSNISWKWKERSVCYVGEIHFILFFFKLCGIDDQWITSWNNLGKMGPPTKTVTWWIESLSLKQNNKMSVSFIQMGLVWPFAWQFFCRPYFVLFPSKQFRVMFKNNHFCWTNYIECRKEVFAPFMISVLFSFLLLFFSHTLILFV